MKQNLISPTEVKNRGENKTARKHYMRKQSGKNSSEQ